MRLKSRNERNSVCLNSRINVFDSVVAKTQQPARRFQSRQESPMLQNNLFFAACASLAAISFAATQTQIESQPQSPSLVTSSGSIGYQSQATPSLVVPVQSLPSANANGAYQSSAIGSGSTSKPSYNTQAQAAGVRVSPASELVVPPAPSISSVSAVPFSSVAPPVPAPFVPATYEPVVGYQPAIIHGPAVFHPPAVIHAPAVVYPPVARPIQPNCFSGG